MSFDEERMRLLAAAFGGHELTVERLSGGLHGRCYRVTSASFDLAVRMPAGGEGGYQLDSRREQRVLARAAAAGIAPPVAPTDPDLGLVATKFVAAARTWRVADAQQMANIDRIAARLKLLHASDVGAELEPFACVAAAEAYARAAAERQTLDAEQRSWSEELMQLARRFEARHRPAAPCHNDLVASNVLDDGELWLVDFEYAALSAPILDLASLAGLNDYDDAQGARLVAAYYGPGSAPVQAAQLAEAVRLVRLLAYFWALAYGGSGPADAQFAAFADATAAVLR